jgi:hypothetical protein
MYHARAKHCNICNKQCIVEEHLAKAWQLQPGTSKMEIKARQAITDSRKSQRTMDEFSEWQVPEHLKFDIKQPQLAILLS